MIWTFLICNLITNLSTLTICYWMKSDRYKFFTYLFFMLKLWWMKITYLFIDRQRLLFNLSNITSKNQTCGEEGALPSSFLPLPFFFSFLKKFSLLLLLLLLFFFSFFGFSLVAPAILYLCCVVSVNPPLCCITFHLSRNQLSFRSSFANLNLVFSTGFA